MSDEADENQVKVIFPLEQDEDGYPPIGSESLWATRVPEGYFEIDNVPFYVRGISPGDIVSTFEEDGGRFFDKIVSESGSSVLRVIVFAEEAMPDLRTELLKLGCELEIGHIPTLWSIEVPAEADFDSIVDFLEQGEKEDRWEYETASIRH